MLSVNFEQIPENLCPVTVYIMFGGWVEAKKMFFKAPTKS